MRTDPTTHMSVMLLEDNIVLAEQVLRSLRDWSAVSDVVHARSCAEGIAMAAGQGVDVLIADLHLPDGSGVEVIREVRFHHPAAIIIVMSVLNEGPTVLEAIRAGAAGYVEKGDASLDVISSINLALEGKAPMSGTIARLIVQSLHAPPKDEAGPRIELTERETEVLNAVARGFSNREVAEILKMSPQTVPVHTRNIYRKLEASNKTEAVFIARQHGLIP